MTLKLENDLDILKMYFHTEMKLLALKLYKTSWLDKNLSNRILKQLTDGASTTKDGKEFHNLTTLSVRNISNIILEYILVTYTYYL